MLLTISALDSNGNCLILRNSGPNNQLFDCKTSTDIPRVAASVGLSLEATWFHSSTLVCSKISQTQFEINIGCLVVELSHCKTVVLSVHVKNLLTFTVRARQVSCLSRTANSAACNSRFETVITFMGATRVLSWTISSSVWGPQVVTRARRNATELKSSCELPPNICNARFSNFPTIRYTV